MTRISIAILHFGKIETTNKCLDSISKLNTDKIDLSVFVVNNDPGVVFPEIKSLGKTSIVVVNNKVNNGFSGGHNQGFEFSLKNNSDYHVVLNNDVTLDKDIIIEMVNCFKNNENVGIVSPKIYFSKGDEYHKNRYKKSDLGKVIWYAGGLTDWDNLINKHRGVDEVDEGQYEDDIETGFATGACAMLPAKIIKKIKGFDERYFLYYEDGDLNMRIKDAGYRSYYCAKAKMWHKNAASSSSGSTLQDYYISRNRMLFGFSYAPLRTKIALSRESFKMLTSGRKWQKIGIRDFYMRRFGKGSYPIQ